MMMLVAKVTLLFLAGLIAVFTTRRSTAALRHMLLLCTLAGSLILPAAALVPSRAVAFRLPAIQTAVARSQAIGKMSFWPSPGVLAAFWILGAALLLLRLSIGHWRIRRVIRAGDSLAPGLYAAGVTVPIASGVIRPVVLMPREAAEWPQWQRAAAVRHERAHIERGDLTANFIAHVACAVYWFHPLVWVLSSLLRREQETACDDAVLRSGFEPATYAEALLAVAQNSTSTLISLTPTTGCAMTTQIDVKSRIMRLLDRSIARTTSTATLRYAAVAVAALVLAIGIPVLAQEPYHVGGDVKAPSVAQKVDPAYTEAARKAKISGPVMLSITVGVDGLAHDISVTRSLDPGLDQKAVEAVQQWHFNPGTRNGEPVPVIAAIEINFKLQ